MINRIFIQCSWEKQALERTLQITFDQPTNVKLHCVFVYTRLVSHISPDMLEAYLFVYSIEKRNFSA